MRRKEKKKKENSGNPEKNLIESYQQRAKSAARETVGRGGRKLSNSV